MACIPSGVKGLDCLSEGRLALMLAVESEVVGGCLVDCIAGEIDSRTIVCLWAGF